MLRALSILLLLAGLMAAGFGLARLLEAERPHPAAAAPGPAGMIEAPQDQASAGPVRKGEAPPPLPAGGRSAAPADELAFQPMMEPSLMPGPALPDNLQDRLKTVPIAHESPASASYRRPFQVTFAIDATGDSSAADALPGRGAQETGEARVSERAEVRLSGEGFEIDPASPAVQLLSPLTENIWRWSVTPVATGEQELVFEVFALVGEDVLPVRTYRDTVSVRISGLNGAIALADEANPIAVLLGGLGSILAGLIGLARFMSRK